MLHRGHAHQHVMRGEIHDRKGGALLERPAGGEGEHRARWDDDQLALTAEPRCRDDQVPTADRGDPLAHGIDRAGHFVADGARGLRGVGVQALSGEQVREVDARGVDPDPYRARLDAWLRCLPYLEDLGRPVAGDDQLSHASSARITCAVSGQALVNSTDRSTAGSISSRRIERKPKRGKNPWAVSVSRYTVFRPWERARARTASVSWMPRPRPRCGRSTAIERTSPAVPYSSTAPQPTMRLPSRATSMVSRCCSISARGR